MSTPVLFTVSYESPIGRIEIQGSEAGVSVLDFVDPGRSRPRSRGKSQLPTPLADALAQIDEYFRSVRTAFTVKLDLRGTDFQKEVWARLLRVKFGQTTTYKALAASVGRPAAAGRFPEASDEPVPHD